jgi:hypothetical protein
MYGLVPVRRYWDAAQHNHHRIGHKKGHDHYRHQDAEPPELPCREDNIVEMENRELDEQEGKTPDDGSREVKL